MITPFLHITRLSTIVLFAVLITSCATYNQRISGYYSQMVNGRYEAASSSIDKIKLLKLKRNRLLYLMEKGKLAHVMQQYDSSNRYFNEADLYMEDARTTAGDIALGTLLNPMMQTYRGESFEKFMVHYYKAMNYLALNQPNDAMVEARRISLQNYALQDKTNNNSQKYSDDAFSLMLQGLIYERSNDLNNAFISYRNATEIYLKNNNSWYGVQIPDQLKQDLLRTAYQNGFTGELERYEKIFNTTYRHTPQPAGGEMIPFWENGFAPVKQEQSFFFALTKDGLGNFAFVDQSGSFNIPFDFTTGISRNDLRVEDLRSLRVAFPRYQEQPLHYNTASVTVEGETFRFEKAEDINALAFATLRERFLKDMSVTLSRIAVKKLAEIAARPKEDAKNKNEKEALAMAIQLFALASEKADTRNWQSLPHSIYYTRVSLKQGANEVKVAPDGQGSTKLEFSVVGNGELQFRNVHSF